MMIQNKKKRSAGEDIGGEVGSKNEKPTHTGFIDQTSILPRVILLYERIGPGKPNHSSTHC
jgi:hypothetical protein